jgi:hypothetical protein
LFIDAPAEVVAAEPDYRDFERTDPPTFHF